jgi:hypothetical protein
MGQKDSPMSRPAGADNLFRISRNGSNQNYRYFKISVPREIAEALPEDLVYSCELTDDGILYRPVTQAIAITDLPEWAKPKT